MSISNRTGHRPRLRDILAAVSLAAVSATLVAGCQPAAQEGGNGDALAAAALSSDQVIEMERGLWEALSAGDYESFAQVIADDATMVGAEGLVTKQEMMTAIEGGTMESYEVGDFQVMQPGSDVAVVTYRYSETYRPADADSAMSYAGWATSIWENRDGTWMTVFHQSSEEPPSME